jgi:hypothetical protein
MKQAREQRHAGLGVVLVCHMWVMERAAAAVDMIASILMRIQQGCCQSAGCGILMNAPSP